MITLHQDAYAQHLVRRFDLQDARTNSIPTDPNVILQPTGTLDAQENSVPYREAIGCLTFAAIVSRLDIGFAVNNVSRFTEANDNSHWQAVKRIVKYLKETLT